MENEREGYRTLSLNSRLGFNASSAKRIGAKAYYARKRFHVITKFAEGNPTPEIGVETARQTAFTIIYPSFLPV